MLRKIAIYGFLMLFTCGVFNILAAEKLKSNTSDVGSAFGTAPQQEPGQQQQSTTPLGQNQGMSTGTPSIKVVQPNGSVTWSANGQYMVLWQSSGISGAVRIRLFLPGDNYRRTVKRNVSASLGRAIIKVPSDIVTGNYTLRISTHDGSVLDDSDQQIAIQGISGNIYPDLAVVDIARLVNPDRIDAWIQNNGAASFEGTLSFKIAMVDPDGPYNAIRDVSMVLSIGPGEKKWISLLKPFNWPSPIELTQLHFTVVVDSDQAITETHEDNNTFQKILRVPCNSDITDISFPVINEIHTGWRPIQYLHGAFGRKQGSKTVCLLKGNQRVKYYPFFWHETMLEVNLGSIRPGKYRAIIYCTDPDEGIAYAGKPSPVFEIKKKEDKKGSTLGWGGESNSDARNIADALSEDFTDGLSFHTTPGIQIHKLRIQRISDGIEMHCYFTRWASVKNIAFEIWKDDFRLRYLDASEAPLEGEYYHAQDQARGLSPGTYKLICRIRDRSGTEVSKTYYFVLFKKKIPETATNLNTIGPPGQLVVNVKDIDGSGLYSNIKAYRAGTSEVVKVINSSQAYLKLPPGKYDIEIYYMELKKSRWLRDIVVDSKDELEKTVQFEFGRVIVNVLGTNGKRLYSAVKVHKTGTMELVHTQNSSQATLKLPAGNYDIQVYSMDFQRKKWLRGISVTDGSKIEKTVQF